ncbi:MAG: phosphatase PAP2 family protein [Clostridia bacterium]|nr:phosphatase PAP2 family protein [Clostridia bacterium]
MDAIFNSFLGFDLGVFQWVQSIQSSFLTTLMVIITTLGDEGIIFIAMGLVLLCTKKYRKLGVATLAALVVMVICNNLILKELFERVRPFYIFDLEALLADKQAFIDKGRLAKWDIMVEKVTALKEMYPEMAEKWTSVYTYPNFVEKLTSFSFPSGHTSSAFAAAVAVLWYNRKFGIPLTVFAAIMGFTRIYVQVHYCSDVIAAAFVGVIYALIGVLIAKLVFPLVDKIFDKVFSIFKKKA